ncbi:ABC transporter permease [Phytoactinopolyspora limicola]|uniref:ABC transporter permease n=1 Tax=Phytoactinopolyspora limicola TaxID=2715536 RepID=UPI001407D38E|nr:ABC transporter permease [Phytoactinopolyspora limicola]
MTTRTEPPIQTEPDGQAHRLSRMHRMLLLVALGFIAISLVRVVSGEVVLTSSGTARAMLTLALPIAMCALGGLVAERAGVINIGLEGMMILGTWGAGFGGWHYGPWGALLGALIGGALGGLLHAVATVSFGVDHIVSGVAINLVAAGLVRFLSEAVYTDATEGGGPTMSPPLGSVSTFDVPILSSGPNVLGRLENTGVFLISDVGGLLRGLTSGLTVFTLIALAMIPLVWFILWRTALGLRWRSAGESPVAAESLGVNVYRMKYLAVVVSGALAGLGGFVLVMFEQSYREGQTGGRGFIGLAAMIFGNWRPGGLLAGSGLFGYADAVRLRAATSAAILALLLLVGLILAAVGIWDLYRRRYVLSAVLLVLAGLAVVGWAGLDALPHEVTTMTPYLVTLAVLATASQRLRPPAADGVRYRRGEEH